MSRALTEDEADFVRRVRIALSKDAGSFDLTTFAMESADTALFMVVGFICVIPLMVPEFWELWKTRLELAGDDDYLLALRDMFRAGDEELRLMGFDLTKKGHPSVDQSVRWLRITSLYVAYFADRLRAGVIPDWLREPDSKYKGELWGMPGQEGTGWGDAT